MKIACVLCISLLATILNAFVTNPDNHTDYYHTCFWKHYKHAQHDYKEVQQCYKLLFAHNPAVYIYPTFIEHLFENNNHQGIVTLMPLLEKSIELTIAQKMMVAHSYMKINNISQALALYERIALTCADDPTIMIAIIQAYASMKEYNAALRHIERLISSTTKTGCNAILYFLKAQMLMGLCRFEEAEQSIVKSIQYDEHMAQSWLLLAIIQAKRGYHAKAAIHYQRYADLNENSSEFCN